MPKPGLLVVLSAPSGAGKASVLRKLRERGVPLLHPVSVTTRAPRPGEQEGVEYYFRSREEFDALRAAGEFVEWAEVHGNCYGTLRSELERCVADGHDVALELDVQGMRNLRQAGLPVVSVFLMPPNLAELERRLRLRAQDDDDDIRLRLENAHDEIAAKDEYDHVIVNDNLEEAVNQFALLIAEERTRR